MCVGCFEISIGVIVKHVESIRIIKAFVCLWGLGEIFSAWGDRKNCWLWFTRGGISTQAVAQGAVSFQPPSGHSKSTKTMNLTSFLSIWWG